MSVPGYASDRVLVDADWAIAHLDDPNVRFVEVDVDTTAYSQGHIPGAVGWDWTSQLSDGVRRDLASREDFSALLSSSGIGPDTTIILYGDNNNWFAAFAYWQLKLFGHRDVRIINGGRRFWLDNGLPISVDEVTYPATGYELPEPDFSLRAYRDDILPRLGDAGLALVDVRSPLQDDLSRGCGHGGRAGTIELGSERRGHPAMIGEPAIGPVGAQTAGSVGATPLRPGSASRSGRR